MVLSSMITVHPLSRNGFHEVWETHAESLAGREFESNGIIGYIYPIDTQLIWCNATGRPTRIFASREECQEWLESKGHSVEWL